MRHIADIAGGLAGLSALRGDAMEHVPPAVRAHGLRAAHRRPLVSLDIAPMSSFRVEPSAAWRYPLVQYGHAGSAYAAVVLDCDHPERLQAGLWELPPPSWAVYRRSNGHASVSWCLSVPVHRYPTARPRPLRMFAAVCDYFAIATSADPGYAGILARNPVACDGSAEWFVRWGATAPYTLGSLSAAMPARWQPPPERLSAVGRNCDLFAALVRWAGRVVNADSDVLAAARQRNARFGVPLPESEVVATARMVERYRARWRAHGWHSQQFRARQSVRGSRNPGRQRAGSAKERKPWDAEGVSRATWYRRRAGARARARGEG